MSDPQSVTGRVLVVDDDANNRDMLSRRLERRGHVVSCADDGKSALERIAASPFDLVLLDINMPGMDGFEALEALRKISSPSALPVIMATAKDDREDIVRALALGANDYVTKPLDFPVVAARVTTQLSLKRAMDEVLALKQNLEETNQRMKRDLLAAARLQRALLPSGAPDTAGFGFAWDYRPCDELAGDILGVFRLSDRHVGAYLLDVSGHGVPAALLSVTLSRMLAPIPGQSSLVRRRLDSATAFEPTAPVEVVEELNRRFQMSSEVEQYFTLFYGVLDTTTRELAFTMAGHPAPLLVSRDGELGELSASTFPIGWVPDAGYEQMTVQLAQGDRLLLYSDGVSEAMNPDRVMFGSERIGEHLRESRGLDVEQSLGGIIEAAAQWCGGPFTDDVSALMIEAR